MRQSVQLVTVFLALVAALARGAWAANACPTPPLPSWSKPEQYVWQQVCAGKIADFNELYGKSLNPSKVEGWSEERALSPEFLETILLYEPFRAALNRHGVTIEGAWFRATLDLSEVQLTKSLRLVNLRFDRDLALYNARIGGDLALDGATIGGSLKADQLRVNGSVFLRGKSTVNTLSLVQARIDGNLELDTSTVKGLFRADGLEVAGNVFARAEASFNEIQVRGARVGGVFDLNSSSVRGVFHGDALDVKRSVLMREANFKEIRLPGATIGGNLELDGSSVTDSFVGDQLEVGGSIYMRDGATFNRINLNGAKVGSQLSLVGGTFSGVFKGQSVEVGNSILIKDADLQARLDLYAAQVSDSVEMLNSSFTTVRLAGSRIDGALVLGVSDSLRARWPKGGGLLILSQAHAAALQDHPAAWPATYELEGFTYDRLGAGGWKMPERSSDRPTEIFLSWLGKHPYSPDPYEQLAGVLRASGQEAKADDILYASRNRARATLSGWDYVFQTLQCWFIGYGYRWWWSGYWMMGFIFFGWPLLWATGERNRHDITLGFAYSADMFLPVIRLREKHHDIDLSHAVARNYFYVHKLMGYVLVSFLIAGLVGLTK